MARPFMFADLCQRPHPLKHSLAESIFVSQVRKTAEKIFVSRKIRQQGHSLAEVSLYFNTLMCAVFVFQVQHFRRAYSDNERNEIHLGCSRCTSSCIYIAYLSFQRPSLRMLPYCPERSNLHCPNYRFCPLRHCQFSTDATSCGLQFIPFALHYCTITLL